MKTLTHELSEIPISFMVTIRIYPSKLQTLVSSGVRLVSPAAIFPLLCSRRLFSILDFQHCIPLSLFVAEISQISQKHHWAKTRNFERITSHARNKTQRTLSMMARSGILYFLFPPFSLLTDVFESPIREEECQCDRIDDLRALSHD